VKYSGSYNGVYLHTFFGLFDIDLKPGGNIFLSLHKTVKKNGCLQCHAAIKRL